MLKKNFILFCIFLAVGTVLYLIGFCTQSGSSSNNTQLERSSTRKFAINITGDTGTIDSDHILKKDISKPTAQTKSFKGVLTEPTIDNSIINGVKKVLFFVGHERSCHSFVSSIIDAHPHMILATNYNPLWIHCSQPQSFPTKKEFFNILADYARRHGARYAADTKGYSLIVDPRYQGVFEGDLQVIGSERAAPVTSLYRKTPKEFEKLISHIKEVVGVPVLFIRVIRNPYDNIATGALFLDSVVNTQMFVELKKQQSAGTLKARYKVDKLKLKGFAKDYFSRMEASEGVLKTSDKYLDVYCDRLIADPKEVISDLCNFLEVECFKDYIETCASKVFNDESSTRKIVEWPEDVLQYIKTEASKYPNLSNYISSGVD